MSDLDQIDDRILRELSSDGRIRKIDLADRIGLSPSACLRLVAALERAGIISGYRAVLDKCKLGQGFTAYVGVGLSDHSKASQEAFERSMSQSQEVCECHNITGTIEYLLRAECADLGAYKVFHTEVPGTSPQVNSITSYVVVGSPKDQHA